MLPFWPPLESVELLLWAVVGGATSGEWPAPPQGKQLELAGAADSYGTERRPKEGPLK